MPHDIEKLLTAADLIRAFRRTLDTTEHRCECCHSRRYDNWPEAKAAIELEAVENKLRTVLARMKLPIDKLCAFCDISSEGAKVPPKEKP